MSDDGESQQVLDNAVSWEAYFHSPALDTGELPQGGIVDRVPHGDTQRQSAGYARKPWYIVKGSTACTSVAMNGAVKRNGAGLAHAAENVARWKTYLPEACVSAMMNAGWHWST
jgi:hypothetical protein